MMRFVRAARATIMTHLCRIGTEVATPDGSGGEHVAYTYGEPIPCATGTPTYREYQRFEDKIVSEKTIAITMPFGTLVSLSDVIEIDGSTVYQVIERTSGGDYETAVRVLANIIDAVSEE